MENRLQLKSFSHLIISKIITAGIILSLSSCALMVAPSGGPKDNTPPKVEKEFPKNRSTAFTEKKITLKFDEYIQLKDAEEQIVISPPMEQKPQFEISGKSLIINMRGPLKPNTTYTINFGNSIADNHESNVLPDYSYVFSTGESIDSLKLSGFIYNSFNNKPEKGFSVCLYPLDSFTDSTIFKNRPFYFTKTLDAGNFLLTNLPPQTFKLVAFKDDNKNLKYDKNELIGFYSTTVNTTDSGSIFPIYSFKPDAYAPNRILDTFSRETGAFIFVLFKPKKQTIKPSIKTEYYSWYKTGKDDIDTLTLYSPLWKTDSILFDISTEPKPVLIKPRKTNKTSRFEVIIKRELELGDSITINFNHPYSTITWDTSRIKLKEDSILIKPQIFETPNKDIVKLYYPWKEHQKYSLEIKDSTILDIYSQYNKKVKINWNMKGLKDYSTLALSFIHPDDKEQYIAQITDESETKIYKTYILNGSINLNLENVLPGKYRVKIIRDTNRNNVWDNGDYQTQLQPEKVFYYLEILTLRAYWDLEQTIDLKKFVN
jgi:uncharacterized protein (DUF2141 family)